MESVTKFVVVSPRGRLKSRGGWVDEMSQAWRFDSYEEATVCGAGFEGSKVRVVNTSEKVGEECAHQIKRGDTWYVGAGDDWCVRATGEGDAIALSPSHRVLYMRHESDGIVYAYGRVASNRVAGIPVLDTKTGEVLATIEGAAALLVMARSSESGTRSKIRSEQARAAGRRQ